MEPTSAASPAAARPTEAGSRSAELESVEPRPASIPSGPADAVAAEPSSRVLSALLEISGYVGSDLGLEETLNRIVRATARTMGVQTSSIYLWDETQTRLVMRSNVGFEPSLVGRAAFAAGRGIPGWVAEAGRTLALPDATRDARYDPLPTTRERAFFAYLCSPLKLHGQVIGVMTARKDHVHHFTPDEVTVFETICQQVAIEIEKTRMRQARIEAEKLAAVALSLSGVAHYIKNVLMTMRGGEYLIDAGLKRESLDQLRQGWKVLKKANRKISALVENMLNYYRVAELHMRPVDLNALLLEVLENLEERAIDHQTTLLPDLDLRLGEIEIDPDRIHDALINLVTNALDAIPPGRPGVVRVQTRLEPERSEVRIEVHDNGCGVAPEHQGRLFHLFFSTKGSQGTGIGLAATRKLILDHGGDIDFETRPGEGTTFTLRLPLRQSRV